VCVDVFHAHTHTHTHTQVRTSSQFQSGYIIRKQVNILVREHILLREHILVREHILGFRAVTSLANR
jgi:hypothetical protein